MKHSRFVFLGCLLFLFTADLYSIPYFARKFGVSCQTCHIHPPKVNALGEEFLLKGYGSLSDMLPQSALPLTVWISGLAQNTPQQTGMYRGIPNRIELISAGKITDDLSWFAEWRVLSRELIGTGTVRDRSGRFEDLFLMYDLTKELQLWIGQYRALTQIDVSRRLALSEPLVFSQSLPGPTASYDRLTSLRGFSPSGRSPSVRLFGMLPDQDDALDGWYGVATVPFPGELSIPLGSEPRRNASFEFEGIPKGVFLEAYRRWNLSSLGVNYFVGSEGRQYVSLVATHQLRQFFAAGTIARVKFGARQDWRWSAELEYIPFQWGALGTRVDHRTGTSLVPLFIPYLSAHFPATIWTGKVVFEMRLRNEQKPQAVVELSLIF